MRAVALLVLALAGCATTGSPGPTEVVAEPFGPIPPSMAQVCIVRPRDAGAIQTTRFRDNGVLVGLTRGGSFFCYFAAPGTHRIAPDGAPEIATLDVTAGRRYLLHHAPIVGSDEVLWVDTSGDLRLLGECEHLELAEVGIQR
jgi:hypothetical protein